MGSFSTGENEDSAIAEINGIDVTSEVQKLEMSERLIAKLEELLASREDSE